MTLIILIPLLLAVFCLGFSVGQTWAPRDDRDTRRRFPKDPTLW
jgi:hypothetical protein